MDSVLRICRKRGSTRWRAAGVEVLWFRKEVGRFSMRRYHLRRLHRKLALIDEHSAFVGGINIIDDLSKGLAAPRLIMQWKWRASWCAIYMRPCSACGCWLHGRIFTGRVNVTKFACCMMHQFSNKLYSSPATACVIVAILSAPISKQLQKLDTKLSSQMLMLGAVYAWRWYWPGVWHGAGRGGG